MTLRTRLLLYLLEVHLLLAVLAVLTLAARPGWLVALELIVVLSLGAGWVLVRTLFVPLDLVRTGADLMGEEDFSCRFRPVGQPEIDSLVAVYNRMIDRLREERLRLQEHHFLLERIFHASPAGLVMLDHDGRIAESNPAAVRLLGLRDPAQAVARRPGDVGASLGPALQALPVGASRVLPLHGSRRVRATRSEFFDRGFPRSFFLLEELTEELRASERASYHKLIRMMSHEINNSVGSVASLLDSCRGYGTHLPSAARTEFLRGLEVAGERLHHLNDFMRGFAEVVRLPEPDLRPEDLLGLVDDILALLAPELEQRRIRCRWDERAELLPIPMDKNQMEQALMNILRNAAEAIGSEGDLSLAVSATDGRGRLVVRDSGPGVAPDAAVSLFTPFFSTKKNGRGIGLTLVQEILIAHRFEFGLQNRPEGGAEFWVVFPAAPGIREPAR